MIVKNCLALKQTCTKTIFQTIFTAFVKMDKSFCYALNYIRAEISADSAVKMHLILETKKIKRQNKEIKVLCTEIDYCIILIVSKRVIQDDSYHLI